MIRNNKMRMVSTSVIVEHLVTNKDAFLASLAEKLMLDELLCGEANTKDFLIECMREVVKDQLITHHEQRISRLKGE